MSDMLTDILGFDLFEPVAPPSPKDDALEAAIARAGTDRVMARARANGWAWSNPPPKWVWYGIVAELEREAASPSPTT
jgi:hypothetical protein